jgi:hypothetical protein
MKSFLFLLLTCSSLYGIAQFSPEQIHSDFVLYQRRTAFDRNMREQTIRAAFARPLDSNSEDAYREACWAIAQFLFRSQEIEKGFTTLFNNYHTLDISTKRALTEAVYAVYPSEFTSTIHRLITIETDARLFAMQAVYLYRADHEQAQATAQLREQLQKSFPGYISIPVLAELDHYLLHHTSLRKQSPPAITDLFRYNQQAARKTIYSFQRWNRDRPGLAIIQLENGHFARDSTGRLLVFRQLARSSSDLPYFITNGSTPQGIYSIQGTAVSHNNLIGPTPNIQLVMPGEADSVYWHDHYDSTQTDFDNYLALLPASWREYSPMREAYAAGHIGRTEIIAHGTTIDPEYFRDKPYYPLTPTMGCLCARENWNIFTGGILQSEQLQLVNSFVSTPGTDGYLYVINLDNQARAVDRQELETLVQQYEAIPGNHQ